MVNSDEDLTSTRNKAYIQIGEQRTTTHIIPDKLI